MVHGPLALCIRKKNAACTMQLDPAPCTWRCTMPLPMLHVIAPCMQLTPPLYIICMYRFGCFVFDLVLVFVWNLADNNSLTGSIPSEIGLLTELTNLELGKWLIWVLIYLFIYISSERRHYSIQFPHMTHHHVVLVFVLNLAGDNSLTGSIPSEIILLTELTYIDLGK